MTNGKNELNLNANKASLFVPDGKPLLQALERITHLGVGAHQDDLEFHALQGILKCWSDDRYSFGGVTCTNGSGCVREGPYAGLSDEQMQRIRHREQDTAAIVGRYGIMVQLGYPSSRTTDASDGALEEDLRCLLRAMRPEVVYTHNLADKHATHVAVVMKLIAAIRGLPAEFRPSRLIGFECWRALDWLPDEDKIRLDVSTHQHLAAALAGVFDSQIAGGKRYDLATVGRQVANATLFDPRAPDGAERVTYAMDLTPLIHDDAPDPLSYALGLVEKFTGEICKQLERYALPGSGPRPAAVPKHHS